ETKRLAFDDQLSVLVVKSLHGPDEIGHNATEVATVGRIDSVNGQTGQFVRCFNSVVIIRVDNLAIFLPYKSKWSGSFLDVTWNHKLFANILKVFSLQFNQ